ncbi:MAG: C40 family peptidase [Ferruginibacter sp.]|nr:C40 family peptidase [Cytophagales bacterium]
MDCSGLLVTSFKAASLTIPRTSGEQARFGKAIRPAEVRPGDLLFFAEKKGGRQVSHVGMVTTVRGRDEVIFIHSTVHRGVMEDALSSEHYQKIFIKATRPF